MKSPWKLLVGLASPRRAVKDAETHGDFEAEEAEAKSQASSAPALVPKESIISDFGSAGVLAPKVRTDIPNLGAEQGDVAIERRGASEETVISAIDELGVGNDNAVKRMRSRRSPATKTPRRKENSSNANLAEVASVEYAGQNSSMQPPLTFGDEVAALDEDVKQLRLRLADKLRVQNTQLRKLLDRYGVS